MPRHSQAPRSPVNSARGAASRWRRTVVPVTVLRTPWGIPGWRSGLAPAFGPGRDPGDPGSSPTSGSRCMEPASPSACVSACLSLSLSVIEAGKGGFHLGQNQRTRPKKAGASPLGRVLLTQRGTRWQEKPGRKALMETGAGRSPSFAVEMDPSVDGTGDTRRDWIMPSAVGRWTGDQGRVRKCRFI
ncbi:unnamed protein product [Nyctereutes procyonoides]|uniref:(raccoon dog) hypothetical protein n=1 Tax=Nyctereutes procyonoides TaxID=34880 RepID=A0A811YA66_NYCPR|nr:unnamed protein product [Nyctereutes procyonoides]